MFKRYKYDIAFSFVQEDIEVVNMIAAEFRRRENIKYYLYPEHEVEGLGQPLFKITSEVYPKSRFVLMVTSRDYVNGFWATVEKLLMLAYIKKHFGRIIQLKLDNTVVDGLSNNLVHLRWRNDAGRIAGVLIEKILRQRSRERKARIILGSILSILMSLLLAVYFFYYLPIIKPGFYPLRQLSPKPIGINVQHIASDSSSQVQFFLNETEITVAEYRQYCHKTNRVMPSQPWPVMDNNPVVNITWQEARDFSTWSGGRLPSESEWQYAASANLQTKYAGGNNAGKVAVYNRKHFRPAATKTANGFGIYDLSGNVAEWSSTSSDSSNNSKIVKGGSHHNSIYSLLITSRDTQHVNVRSPYIGFRVAWDTLPSFKP